MVCYIIIIIITIITYIIADLHNITYDIGFSYGYTPKWPSV